MKYSCLHNLVLDWVYVLILTTLSILTIVWVGIKYIVLDIESTMVITESNSMDSGSFIMKFMLIVSYLVFGTERRCSLSMGRCQMGFLFLCTGCSCWYTDWYILTFVAISSSVTLASRSPIILYILLLSNYNGGKQCNSRDLEFQKHKSYSIIRANHLLLDHFTVCTDLVNKYCNFYTTFATSFSYLLNWFP